jgi:isopenicillin N synthase-like dioxygenase
MMQEALDTGLVPIIDLTPLREGKPEAKQELAQQINHACETIGFFAIKGADVPRNIVDHAWDASRRFFDLSVEQKNECIMTPDYPYGYMGYKHEQLSAALGNSRPPDLKESFQVCKQHFVEIKKFGHTTQSGEGDLI